MTATTRADYAAAETNALLAHLEHMPRNTYDAAREAATATTTTAALLADIEAWAAKEKP